ncbi:MAG: hypothetical protein DRN15_00335 [Thermoprotei archaeon]|nr:MAG: hypothetical protein DRN15_00335 [Thermoprotei archaeon]
MGLADIEDMRKYYEKLKKRKVEIEKEFEELIKRRKRGEISEEEYEERKRKLEREYVEIMDRIVQMRYLIGEERLFG